MQACFNSKGEKGPEQSTTGFQKGIFLAIKKKKNTKNHQKPPQTMIVRKERWIVRISGEEKDLCFSYL